MHEFRPRRLFCGVCGGRGLVRVGALCPHCEGAGCLRRLALSVPVVSRSQARPTDGPCWLRLAVLSSEVHGERMVGTGISDEGRGATAGLAQRAMAGARTPTFLGMWIWA